MRRSLHLLLLAAACHGADPDRPAREREAEAVAVPAPATLRKLTESEYLTTLGDLLGPDVVLPTAIEPDLEVAGQLAVGAGQAAVSPLGVEQYETAAYLIAGQVLQDPAIRALLVSCTPAATVDDVCAGQFVSEFGLRAWRRPLTAGEQAALVTIAGEAANTLGDFWSGLEYAMAGLLQSPHFLYRVEIGADGRFDDWEIASRLSYLLWHGPPDDALLDAAAAGTLVDPADRAAEIERMLADPRARRGVRALFDDALGLYALEDLSKDPLVFLHYSDEVGPSAREETLRLVEYLAFDADNTDFRQLVLSRTTFVDRALAAIYGIAAPSREGFGRVDLDPDGPRAGLLGQASFLAQQAHPVSTSVTRRGVFIRTSLLCQTIPPPPADVDTSIPEPAPELPTMRDRVAVHLQDPVCASCHQITDPLGLALEHFDGIGRYRLDENGATIDASGDLDGDIFDDAQGLAWAVRNHEDFTRCMASSALRYAQGHGLSASENALASWHDEGFQAEHYHWLALLADIAGAESFGVAGVAP